MAPTLRDGQIMLVYKNRNEYKVEDIITLNTQQWGICVKRIWAQFGDKIELKEGKVFKNGIILSEVTCPAEVNQKYILQKDEFFVLGDNYGASVDSRNYGPVHKNDIIGKVIFY